MVQLRPLSLVVLVLVPAGLSAVAAVDFTSRRYERKIERLTEERMTYMALANSAVGLSDRAFTFARGYQETLDICLARVYRPTVLEDVVAKVPRGHGGLGGPIDVRRPSKLP